MKVLLIGSVIGSIALGYILSGIIVVVLMEKIGYDLSIHAMIGHVQRMDISRRQFDESIGRHAIAVNIQMRVMITLICYATIALGLFVVSAGSKNATVATMLFAANVGLIANCLLSILGEYVNWPIIMRYQGMDDEKELHFERIVMKDDELSDPEMTFGLDEAGDVYDMADMGDIIIMFVPPTGDIIYDKIL